MTIQFFFDLLTYLIKLQNTASLDIGGFATSYGQIHLHKPAFRVRYQQIVLHHCTTDSALW